MTFTVFVYANQVQHTGLSAVLVWGAVTPVARLAQAFGDVFAVRVRGALNRGDAVHAKVSL